MKYIAIYHANLNYAYLVPERYEFVIRSSYELIIDTMREQFPDTPYVFEASGYTVEHMASKTPDVLEKLKAAIQSGQCEFMGSPYAHPMLPNFEKEDGLWSIRFSNEIYQRFLGIQPKSFWNPECGWRDTIPQQVIESGYTNLIGDFEAYSRSCGPDGKPNRPAIHAAEYSNEPVFYNFGFNYDLPGDEPAIHFPFDRIQDLPPGQLRSFLRTDRVAQFGVRFFMGMEGYSLDAYMDLIKKYSQQQPDEPQGALIVFADDAEYVGTNGWFRLKFQNKPDNVFEATPQSRDNLIKLITECQRLGEFVTYNQACTELPTRPETLWFDNDAAWHGAQASFWAATPMAVLLRPWQKLVRDKLKQVEADLSESLRHKVWYHLTNSYNSDGQWPPTLPDAPHIIHPFNYGYCFENLLAAELLLGGVDRSQLQTDACQTVQTILSIQQNLILDKARAMLSQGSDQEKQDAQKAMELIKVSQDVSSIRASGNKILYPAEYTIRAEALVAARRRVGGIVIETV